ncbi:protein kish-B isoform X1 [Scyliorhinus canicula]|uniref:protein kish-B isoform X1 n=1 Tax=Scyliorhinus canicula TaxID=7830 RepID=UPI0018F7BD7B|nr:protein kish-B isoform X1 [Scyliorhinus canicula]
MVLNIVQSSAKISTSDLMMEGRSLLQDVKVVGWDYYVYSFDGLLVFGLLFICTCAYLKKVPRLNKWLLSEKKGVWGVFYKAAVIGTRLHVPVALSCLVTGVYVLFIK